MIFSSFYKRRGATLAGICSLGLSCLVLLCAAGSVPVENLLPQGAMQGDLNAGGHSLTNAATLSATNVVVSGSLTAPSSFTLPFSKLSATPTTLAGYGITDPAVLTSGSYANPSWLTSLAYSKLSGAPGLATVATSGAYADLSGKPTLGSLASVTPGGTAASTTFLKFDGTTFSYAAPPGASTSGTALLQGNGSGGISNVTLGSGLTLSSGTLAANVLSVAGRTGAITLAASDISGLGSAATNNASAFDPAGAATAAQSASLQKSSNLSDVGSAITARTNLGLGSAATNSASSFAPASGSTNYASAVSSNNFAGTQAAPDWQVPIGPIGVTLVAVGDSKLSGPVGGTTTASAANALFCGYTDQMCSRLQEMGFFYSGVVVNLGVPSTTLQDGINNFGSSDLTTTGNITAGSNTVTVTGSTSGISNNEYIAGPGIPIGTQVAISGSTLTLFNGTSTKPTLTTTGATLVFSYTSNQNSGPRTTYETAHQLSPAVNTATYPCTVTSGSPTITLNTGTWVIPPGSLVTSAHFSGTVTVKSPGSAASGLQSITVSANATGSSSTEAVTIVPYAMALVEFGTNDGVGNGTYTGTMSTSSPTITGLSGLVTLVHGTAVTGANIPANTTVVSNTATTITLSANPTASGSSSFTLNLTAAVWGAAYSSYVNSFLGAGYNAVLVLTIPPSTSGTQASTNSFTASYTAYLRSTYGTETSPTVPGVQLIDLAAMPAFTLLDPLVWVDGVHYTPLGNSMVADHIQAVVQADFPALLSPLSLNLQQNHAIPSDWINFGPATTVGANLTLTSSSGVSQVKLGSNVISSTDGTSILLGSGSTFATLPISNGTIAVIPSGATSVSGSTSGTAQFSEPFNASGFKKVVIYCTALTGTASYTFPTTFTNPPVVVTTSGPAPAVVTSLSATAVTVTGSATTGPLVLEGY